MLMHGKPCLSPIINEMFKDTDPSWFHSLLLLSKVEYHLSQQMRQTFCSIRGGVNHLQMNAIPVEKHYKNKKLHTIKFSQSTTRHLPSLKVSYKHLDLTLWPPSCSGKISGHKSTYIKVWRCTFGWITKGKSWVKLFECQAEVFGWLTQA